MPDKKLPAVRTQRAEHEASPLSHQHHGALCSLSDVLFT